MSLTRVYAIVVRQLFLLRHNPVRFTNIFVWAVLDIILWGFITKYLNEVGNTGFNFVPVLLGAVVLFDFLTRVMHGVLVAFLEDVWSRNFLNLFASPLSVGEYVLGLVSASILTSAVGFAALVGVAGLLFGYFIFKLGLLLLPFLLILFLFGIALGIFVVAVILRVGPSAEWIAWPVPMLLSPFSGVFYPISVLPSFLQPFAHALPSSYVFEGMRTALFDGSLNAYSLWVGGVLALLYLALAYAFFVATYRYVLRHGLISRFGAENG